MGVVTNHQPSYWKEDLGKYLPRLQRTLVM